jgi:hypothetical protein
MFPISDPSRADDIRMRRRRAVWLLAGIVLVPAILFSGHGKQRHDTKHLQINPTGSIHSDSMAGTQIEAILHRIPLIGGLDWTVEGAPLPAGRRDAAALSAAGSSLVVAVSCARSIALVPQADLSGRVFVSTRNGRPGDAAGLTLTGGAALVLGGECRHGQADLVVQAPASMPLTLVQSGSTDIRLGAFGGPVHLTMTGSGDAAIDAAGSLDIVKNGKGDVSVSRLAGPLRLSSTGSGDVAIAHIQADQVGIVDGGSGDFSISDGHIGHLDATLRGSGDLSITAEIDEASVQALKDNDITLPHVKRRLDRGRVDE